AGRISSSEMIAGGETESIFQPEWSPAGVLHFVSDQTGGWNLYRVTESGSEPVCEMEAECGSPQGAFRMSCYAFESDERIVCAYCDRGTWRLASLDTATRTLHTIDVPYTEI